jgi:hypothetical protein
VDGSIWHEISATRKEAEAAVSNTATALGITNCDPSNARFSMSINLSSYQSKTINLHLSIEAKSTKEKINFLTIEGISVPALTHSYSYSIQTYPTCTTAKVEIGTCACGDVVTRVGEPLGHSYGAWEIEKEPTLFSSGLLVKTCTRDSSHTRTLEIPALNEDDYDIDTILDATCETEGEKEYSIVLDNKEYGFYVSGVIPTIS